MNLPENPAEILEWVDEIEKILHDRAKQAPDREQEETYIRLRRQIVSNPGARSRLPELILTGTNLSLVWGFLRQYASWRERREFVSTGLEPLRSWLEGREAPTSSEPSPMPDSRSLLHSARRVLETQGQPEIANLLFGASSSFILRRNDAILNLRVPVDRLNAFDVNARRAIIEVIRRLLPPQTPWHLSEIQIDPLLQSPPDEDHPLPGPTWKPEKAFQHEGLYFRSKTEVRIYEALKKRSVFFFVNASGVLGGKTSLRGRAALREPDFLICLNGKWGILEVMGEHYHTSQTATSDHNRARLFKEYGLRMIEFYDAGRCYNTPDDVVDEFLKLLAAS